MTKPHMADIDMFNRGYAIGLFTLRNEQRWKFYDEEIVLRRNAVEEIALPNFPFVVAKIETVRACLN